MYQEKLNSTLAEISSFVFELMKIYDENGSDIKQLHEDAITSIILKKLTSINSDEIYVKAKSLKVKESKTGIDLNLWIGQDDSHYLRFAVQAKNFGNQTKISNKYDIDAKQCDKILKHAKGKHNYYPLYFLYQHVTDENISKDFFNSIDGFEHSHSGVTFTSAHNIKKLIQSKELAFSDIHKNAFEDRWSDSFYEIFKNSDKKIGLPLSCLSSASPSKIERYNKLMSTKYNSLGFFFFFFFGEEYNMEPIEISAKEIEERYSENPEQIEDSVEFKNLVIINDCNYKYTRREKLITEILKKE